VDTLAPELQDQLEGLFLRAVLEVTLARNCSRESIKINSVETTKTEIIAQVHAAATPGMLFTVLQPFYRVLIPLTFSVVNQTRVSHLYVEIAPHRNGTISSMDAVTEIFALKVLLAYFNDNYIMYESNSMYHYDGHAGNILKYDFRGEVHGQWADFGITQSIALHNPYSKMETVMNKQFIASTDYLMDALWIKSGGSTSIHHLYNEHKQLRLSAKTVDQYFAHMLNATQGKYLSILPTDERMAGFEKLSYGAGFAFRELETRMSAQDQIIQKLRADHEEVQGTLDSVVSSIQLILKHFGKDGILINPDGTLTIS